MSNNVDWWANLLQGALSAAIGGMVAAVTAWGVVIATGRQIRRQATKTNAIAAAQAAIAEMQLLFAAVQTIQPWKRHVLRDQWLMRMNIAGTRFFTRTVAHQATIAAFDPPFAERVAELRRAIGNEGFRVDRARRWRDTEAEEFFAVTQGFVREVRVWLQETGPP